MTALLTTADFITYESVYLPKNHFIKEESLSTEDYLSYFYPFDKLDFRKNGIESGRSVTDRDGIAITMAMGNAPQAVTMGFQKEYAERYDWIVKEPLSQAGREMNFAARNIKINLTSTNQGKRRKGTNKFLKIFVVAS